MSSPAFRRSARNSINGTPRRTQRNSEAPVSSPVLPAANTPDEQLRQETEQASSQNGQQDADMQDTTPRAQARSSQNESQSQAPPTSSPLFFRSSPGGSQSQSQTLNAPQGANGINISSPLRQQRSALPSSEGGRTPRAIGGLGGRRHAVIAQSQILANLSSKSHHLFTTSPAQLQPAQRQMATVQIARAQAVSSYDLRSQAHELLQ